MNPQKVKPVKTKAVKAKSEKEKLQEAYEVIQKQKLESEKKAWIEIQEICKKYNVHIGSQPLIIAN